MNNLLSYQIEHVNNIKNSLKKYKRALDASDTGTGKTYTSIAVCVELKLKPLIICPKSVLESWRNVIKKFGIEIYGIVNYEGIWNCKYFPTVNSTEKIGCPFIRKIEKNSSKDYDTVNSNSVEKSFTYMWENIPNDFILIFDEAHRCKNKKTINSVILFTAAKYLNLMNILLLSATIADKPEKFYIAGFVLRLYSKISEAANWIEKVNIGHKFLMSGVHKVLFNEYGSRMRIKELGNLFPKNNMIAECFDMDTCKEIEEQYKIIEAEVEKLKNKMEKSIGLSLILYARMKIEQLKIPTFIKLTKEYISKKYSVAIFLNFTQTINIICEELKCECKIYGQQTIEERNKNINDFNSDKSRIIVCNTKSGGVGISLHDTNGNFPRISLISPSYSAQDTIQALGRIFRANTKTNVEQRIIFCKKTIEEKMCESMIDKIKTISVINDGIDNTYDIKGLIDKDNYKNNEEKSEIEIMFDRINVLILKKERLNQDLKDVDDELKTLNSLINNLII